MWIVDGKIHKKCYAFLLSELWNIVFCLEFIDYFFILCCVVLILLLVCFCFVLVIVVWFIIQIEGAKSTINILYAYKHSYKCWVKNYNHSQGILFCWMSFLCSFSGKKYWITTVVYEQNFNISMINVHYMLQIIVHYYILNNNKKRLQMYSQNIMKLKIEKLENPEC